MSKLVIAIITSLALVAAPAFAKGHKKPPKPHVSSSASQLI